MAFDAFDPIFWWFRPRCGATSPIREFFKTACFGVLLMLLLLLFLLGLQVNTVLHRVESVVAELNFLPGFVEARVKEATDDTHRTLAGLDRTVASTQRVAMAAEGTVMAARTPIGDLHRTFELVNRPCPTLQYYGGSGGKAGSDEGRAPVQGGWSIADGSQKVYHYDSYMPGRSLIKPCGTLADLNKTLNTARGTMGQAEVALHHEAANLDRLDGQEQQLVADVHSTLLGLNDDVAAAHTLLTDPHLPGLLAHTEASTASVEHMLSTFDAVETKATHGYLFPSKNPLVRGWRYVSPLLYPGAQIAAAVR